MYNCIDLLEKCIDIKNKIKLNLEYYLKTNDMKINIFAKIFIDKCNKNIVYYKSIIKYLKIEENSLPFINFGAYDKISFLINEYNLKIPQVLSEINSIKDFIQKEIILTKDKLALMIDIQGRLYNISHNKDITYTCLINLIEYIKHDELLKIKK